MQFCRARSLDEAFQLLCDWGEDARVLAGGTDVMVQQNRGEAMPAALIHIESIKSLSTINHAERTTIGTLCTHCQLASDAGMASRNPALARAAGLVGGWQTQSVGTIGGNICNASPAADLAAPMLIADAHVILASESGERRLALADFLLDRRTTARRADELLTSIDVEPLRAGHAEVYLKVGRRGAMDVAIAGLALRLGISDKGTVETARVAVCAVAPTPRRVAKAEAALLGTTLDDAAMAAAGQALQAASTPIDDARGTASYRRRLLPRLLKEAVRQCSGEMRP